MKSKHLLLLMLLAVFAPWAANAQNPQLNEGFESTDFPPTDWQPIHVSGSSNWDRNTSYYNSGSACAYISYATSGHENYLVTPKLTPATGESFSFYIKQTNNSWTGTTITIEVSTTTNDATSFTSTLATYTSGSGGNLSTTFTQMSLSLSDYVGQNIYIAFHVVDNNGNNICIDDVSGVSLYVPCCPKPKNLACTGTTGNPASATFTWTNGGEETQWKLEYSTNSDFTGATSVTINQSDLVEGAYTLNGITGELTYYARICAVCPTCDPNYSEWSNTVSFWPTVTVPVVVNNGTTTNSYVPFYGYYVNKTPNRSQFIISAADMQQDINVGSTIKKMTFHGSTTTNTTFGTATFKFYLKEVDNATFASAEFVDWESLTEVYSGPVFYNNKEMEITFRDDFIYNGGNLLVGVTIDQTNSSTSTSVSWYGKNGSGNNSILNYMGYSSQTGPSLGAFMPKLTFLLIQAEVSCEKPQNLAVSGVTATGANFTWDAEDGATWQYCTFVLPHATPTDADFDSETQNNALAWNNGFTPNTNNIFYLRKKCGENDFSQPISVTFNTLQAITNFACTGYTATTATLGWTDNVYGVNSWQIMLNNDEANPIPVNTNPCTIENLTTETVYTAKVRAACAACPGGWSDWSSAVSFEPTAKQVIGSGTLSTNSTLPFEGNYDYSYTQQIYTVDELGEPGVIESIDFYMTSTSNKTRNLDIYMVTTDKSSFTSSSDWIAVTEANKVFSGNVTFQPAAWTSITIDNGFIYNGTQNIAIIVDDNSGNYNGNSRYFRTYTASAPQSHYGYQDSYNINPSNPSPSYTNTTTAKNQIRILKSEIPNCLPPTGLKVVDNSVTAHNASLSWDAEDGATWQYRLIANPDETLPEDGFTETTEASKDYTDLTPETNYGFYLRKKCGENEFSTVVYKTFTTGIACFAPAGLAVVPNSITNHTANLTWEGTSNSYVVSYRTAAYTDGTEEDFSSDPTDWTRYTGALNSDGTATLTSYNYAWTFNTSNNVFNRHAYMELYSTKNYWLVTPSMTIANGYSLSFDLAYTNWSGNNGNPSTGCTSHRFVVLISVDDMEHWTILREWNNNGTGTDVLDDIPTNGQTISGISLGAYIGETVHIAFFGHSETNSYDNNIHIDNVAIGTPVEAGEWLTVNPEPEEAPVTLTGLLAETKYEAKVKGNCGEDGYSQETASIFFTTDIACPAPTNFTHSNVKSTSVDLSWEDNAEAWQICVNDATTYIDIDTDDVTIAQGVITYTLEGLEPTTPYTVKVRANCGSEDGYSEWTDEESFTTDNACPTPQNLIVVEGSETSQGATLTWTGENDSFDVELGARDYTATPDIVTLMTEGFESTSMPTGWIHIGEGSGAPAASNPYTNSYSLKFNGATANNVVVLPEFEVETNTLTIDFWSKAESTSNSGSFDLGYVTNATNASTFVALETYACKDYGSYVHIENYSMAAAPSGARIAFRHRSGSTAWYWFIDDVTIKGPEYPLVWSPVSTVANENNTGTYTFTTLDPETTYMARVVGKCGNNTGDPSDVVSFTTIEACPAPANFSLVSTSSNSATFSWTQTNGITEWIVKYKKSTDTEYPATYTTVQNTPSTTINNLEANTDYDVQIFAACDTEFEQPLEGSFATDCDVITISQGSTYTYDFESEAKWRCWTNVAGTNKRNADNNHTTNGGYKLQFQGTTTGNIVAMPAFTPDINGLMLTFWTRPENNTYTNCGTFSVGYMTDLTDDESFTAVKTYSYNDWTSNTYVEKKVAFTDAPAGAYIAFCHNAGSTNYYWFVDDVTVELVPAFTKTIIGYASEQGDGGNWYLIASPLADDVDPTTVGMITDELGETATSETSTYDLYRFDQTQSDEWLNYRNTNFNLANGTGYLYANKNDVTLTFAGLPYSGNSKVVTLSNNPGDNTTTQFAGYNLVGNPFTVNAYIGDRDFYVMNNGTEIILADRAAEGAAEYIEPMEGIFVIATEETEQLTFTTTAPKSKGASLALNVSKNRGVVDRAMVRFSESRTLPKFQLRNNSTKVYIPQDNIDYAVVSAEAMGELPVNFRANENGSYTLSFTSEEVSFSYLHLVDNMTGNDVDLLETPSYTFDALTTDYESRFKLVFATGNAADDSFAFYSNGNWIINNDGQATLQVIDVTGRILSSETVTDSVSKAIHAAPGVYMLRLVNGDNVKVQKVVVR